MPDNDAIRTVIETVTALAALTAVLTKPVVDIIKLAFPQLPSKTIPPLAVVAGVAIQLLLAMSTSTTATLTLNYPLASQLLERATVR
jgi:hypothetical protein